MLRMVFISFAMLFAVGGSAFAQNSQEQSNKGVDETGFFASDKTKIDFSDTLIEGQMKAPTGFYIQGRKSQSLSQMVKLRSNFRNELRNSKAALRSLAR